MLPSTSHLVRLVAPAIEALGYELIACELATQGKHRTLLRIYIDSEAGITMRDCELAGRQVSALLDVEDPVSGKYTLEISSPGSDRLLVTEEHFQRVVGRSIRVKLTHPRNDRSNYKGLLQLVVDGNIQIIVDGVVYELPISEIEKANLVPEFPE